MTRSLVVLALAAAVLGFAAAVTVAAPGFRTARAQSAGQPAGPAAGQSESQSAARDRELEQQTREIAKLLRCPVCQNLSVADSPSDLAAQMRALIRDQLVAGRSRGEILTYFSGRYGEEVLLDPPKHGFSQALWWGAASIPAGGLALVALLLRRWVRRPTPPADLSPNTSAGAPDPTVAVVAVPEEELQRYEALLERELAQPPDALAPEPAPVRASRREPIAPATAAGPLVPVTTAAPAAPATPAAPAASAGGRP